MIEKFPTFCSLEQANKIYELLNDKPREIGIELPAAYSISDIFKYLPLEITYNEHRGDLAVTPFDIAYFSISGDSKHILVHYEPIPINGDIYDAFINMIKWVKENKFM